MFRQNSVGFHTILTPEVHQCILDAIPKVFTLTQVAAKSRISHQNLSNWLKRGKKELEEGQNTIFGQLFADYKEKQSEVAEAYLRDMSNLNSFQSVSWILERCFKEDFGAEAGAISEIKEQHEKILKLMEKGNKDEICNEKGSKKDGEEI